VEAEHKGLCQAAVWHRDTYRYTGRGKTGFEMHYRREQCKRRAGSNGLCYQHQNAVKFYTNEGWLRR
jgi:hypothetical protein